MPILSHPVEQEPQSLVSQLQQVHGLTKKKVYSTKPARKPFVRDERIRKEYSGLSEPMVLPTSKISSHTPESGRVVSNFKAARISRKAQGSPTEQHGRRPLPPRRTSQSSLPESDPHPAPSPFTVPSTYMAPVPVPASSVPNVYDYQPIALMDHDSYFDPSWSTQQYNPVAPSVQYNHYPAYSNAVAPHSPADVWRDDDRAMNPPPLPMQNSAMHYTTPSQPMIFEDSSMKISTSDNSTSCRSSRRPSCPEDDEPFTFNAEYVAATAALFKSEILPSYPELRPAFDEVVSPRSAFFNAQEREPSSRSSSSSYCPGELYASAERKEQQYAAALAHKNSIIIAESSRPLYATAYYPGSSSSLTGWAG